LTGGGLAFCGATGEGVCVPSETVATCTALPGAGEACPYDLCAAGLACDGGTCAAPAALGAACQVSAACATGLICDPTLHCAAPLGATAACDASAQCQAGLACDQGACTALAALGDGCDGPPVCGAQRSCGRAPETRTCTDPDASGAPCMTDTCADGLTCASSPPMTCVALPLSGEACLDGYACAAGLTCIDGVGTCAPLPGVGQTCAAGSRFCADGLGCRPSDNTCQPGPGSGQECLLNPPDYVCGAGLGCDFGMTGSTCIGLGAAGAACNTDRTCAVGTYCELSTLQCAARLPDGASCSDGNECLVGHECAARPGGPICQPLPARDQPCAYDCTSGLRCQGPGGQCVRELCVIPG
ncbi:MAG: hypothetical protein NT062_38585, partial [Proteobacteria bacterium]|nr:hypothetical protein [Pseudomonadota bacterium]